MAKRATRPESKPVRLKVARNGAANRPRLTADEQALKQIEALAASGLALRQIAPLLGIHLRTLHTLKNRDERIQEAIDRGRAQCAQEIAELSMDKARGGDTTMLIWLSKNILGWRESSVVEHSIGITQEQRDAAVRAALSADG